MDVVERALRLPGIDRSLALLRIVNAPQDGEASRVTAARARAELDRLDVKGGFLRRPEPIRPHQHGERKDRNPRDHRAAPKGACGCFEQGDEFGPLDDDACNDCGFRYDQHAKPRGVPCLTFDAEEIEGPWTLCRRCGHQHHEHRIEETETT